MERAKVSLYVGTFNPRFDYLKEALTSIPDGLFHEVIIQTDSGRGFWITRNEAIARATGDWVCSLDDDDILIPDVIEPLMRFAHTTTSDIIHFPIQQFGEAHGVWGNANPTIQDFLENNQIPSCSWIRKSLWERIGGYQIEQFEDWDFWVRALKSGATMTYFTTPPYRYRVRSTMRSQNVDYDHYKSLIRKRYEEA